ncbi:MAG: hypothetical protein WKF47_18405 [Geodermatophilaceae bacterium]
MVLLVALVVTAVALVVIWRVIGPDRATPGAANRPRPTRPRTIRRPPQLPPDDNPDFLRDLDRRARPEE